MPATWLRRWLPPSATAAPRRRMRAELLEDRLAPAGLTQPERGMLPEVAFLAADGSVAGRAQAFDPAFMGGVWVAAGDVTGDGVRDVVAVPGPGTAPLVQVFDGASRALRASFPAYEGSFTGGVYAAVADLNADGKAEVIVGTDQGGGPRVRVFDGAAVAAGSAAPGTLADFFAIDDPGFRGGVRVAAGDVNADGRPDIVVSAGFGGGPRIAGFDGKSLATNTPRRLFNDFFAFEPTLRNGAHLAVGDATGDGVGDIVFGAGPGGAPRVRVVTGAGLLAGPAVATLDDRPALTVGNFFAGSTADRGGVRVGTVRRPDGRADVLAVGSATGETTVPVFDALTGQLLRTLDRFAAVNGGLFNDAPPPASPPAAAPVISDIPDQRVTAGQTVGPIGFTVGDPDTPADQLTLSVTTTDPMLVPQTAVAFGGSGANRTVTVVPAAGRTGATTLTVIVSDGGRTAQDGFLLTVDPAPAVPGSRLAAVTPADGTELVSLTNETVVRFDAPIDPASLTGDAFYLLAQGAKVPGRIRVSPTARFATFFPADPLPESTQVRVVVDGGLAKAADGLAVDADADGQPGGVGTADFRTAPVTLIPNTLVEGRVFDSHAKAADGSDIPIAGVRIELLGRPDIFAVTDATGTFVLGAQDQDADGVADGLPAPEFFVYIGGDGGTSAALPEGSKYANLSKPFPSTPGQRLVKPMGIFLPPMAAADVVPLSMTADTPVGFGPSVLNPATMAGIFPDLTPEQRAMLGLVSVTFPAGSAQNPDGSPLTLGTVIPVNPNRLPGPLPEGVDPSLVVSIQAGSNAGFDPVGSNVNFAVPAPVTFPNLDGLAPGEQSLLWSFDHDAGKWVVIGNGTVSGDGKAIVSNPGVGILAPGWHFTQAGSTADMPPDEPPCDCDSLGGDALSALQQSTAEAFSLLSLLAGVVDQIDFGVAGPFLAALGGSLAAAPDPRAKVAGAVLLAASKLGEVGDDALNFISNGSNLLSDSIAAGQVAFGTNSQIQLALALQNLGLPPGSPIQASNDALSLGLSIEGALNQGRAALDALGRFGGNLADCIAQKTGQAVDAAREQVDGLLDELGQAVDAVQDGFNAVQEGIEYITDLAEILSGRRPIIPTLRTADGREEAPTNAQLLADLQETVADYQATMAALAARGVRSPGALVKLQSDRVRQGADRFDELFDAGRTQIGPGAYYTLTLPDGTEQRGRLNTLGGVSLTLPGTGTGAISVFDPASGRAGATALRAGGNGTNLRFQVRLGAGGGADADGDGLPDLAETIVGTNRAAADTDGDGVSDGAEVAQGLNPLDGVGFPTGVIASLPLPGPAEMVAVAGDLAFVATGPHGLAVVDAADFDAPILLGQIDLPGTAVDIDYDPARRIAAVATGDALALIDLADPMAPRLAQTVGFRADRVEVVNGLAYAAADNFVRAIDLSTGTAVQTVFLGGSGDVTGLARDGNTLFAFLSGSDTLFAVDVSSEGQAAVLDQLNVSVGSFDVGLFAGNGVVTIAGSGLRTVNAANPADLQLISGADGNFSARRVALNGSGLALVAPDGGRTLELYSSADPQDTDAFLTRFNLTGPVRDVAVSRGIGYAAVGSRLEVINYRPFDAQGQAPTVALTTTAADADPNAPGVQVIEGGTVLLRAAVTDDVQVRAVEWLVNGAVAGTDVAFPFDFTAVVPTLAAGGGTLTLQARATDTGGNVALSDPVTLTVVPDTFAPTITSLDPADGGRRFQGQRFVRARFSEPLDPAGVTAGTFALFAGDTPVPAEVQLRDAGRLVQLTVPAPGLAPGAYQLRVNQPAVRDRAGNPLGAAPLAVNFTVVEFDQSAEFLPFGSDVSLRQDDNSFAISPMPFAFDFFGRPVGDGPVFVTTNGVVEFGQDTVRGDFTNDTLPLGGERRVVVPFWDDLDPRNAGRIGLFDADGVRAVTFLDVPYFPNEEETVSFQVAFFAGGQIQFRYGAMGALQNGTATVGLADGSRVAVPSLGAIENDPGRAVTDAGGLLNDAGLAALTEDEQNDLLVFTPDGAGGYTIARNPGR